MRFTVSSTALSARPAALARIFNSWESALSVLGDIHEIIDTIHEKSKTKQELLTQVEEDIIGLLEINNNHSQLNTSNPYACQEYHTGEFAKHACCSTIYSSRGDGGGIEEAHPSKGFGLSGRSGAGIRERQEHLFLCVMVAGGGQAFGGGVFPGPSRSSTVTVGQRRSRASAPAGAGAHQVPDTQCYADTAAQCHYWRRCRRHRPAGTCVWSVANDSSHNCNLTNGLS